jgi:hypothetical protein
MSRMKHVVTNITQFNTTGPKLKPSELRSHFRTISVKVGTLTMANIKITVFWDVTICSMVNECRHFKETAFLFNMEVMLPT